MTLTLGCDLDSELIVNRMGALKMREWKMQEWKIQELKHMESRPYRKFLMDVARIRMCLTANDRQSPISGKPNRTDWPGS